MVAGWERIPPGSAPGGLVFRLTAGGRVWREHPFPLAGGVDEVEARALDDGELATELVAEYGEARSYVYDGDTGECVATMVVGGE